MLKSRLYSELHKYRKKQNLKKKILAIGGPDRRSSMKPTFALSGFGGQRRVSYNGYYTTLPRWI